MREACVNSVEQALGRGLRGGEARTIEQRVGRHMRLLAQQDRAAWSSLTEEERYTRAGEAAARELVAEAELAKRRLELRGVRLAAINDMLDQRVADPANVVGDWRTAGVTAKPADRTRLEAFNRLFVQDYSGAQGDIMSIESSSNGMFRIAIAEIKDLIEQGNSGLMRLIPGMERKVDAAMIDALNRVGDPPQAMRDAAKRFHELVDILRNRYNAAGGTIGKLEDWGLPHRWSARLVQKIGREQFIADMKAGANRARYVNDDGTMMTEAQLDDFFSNAFDSITTNGANKRLRGDAPDYAQSIYANRHRAHREIHLRPDQVAPLLQKYSEMTALEAVVHHMRRLSRDVAIIETFGPNAELTIDQVLARAVDEHVNVFREERGYAESRAKAIRKRFDLLAGVAMEPASYMAAQGMAFVRSWQVFTNLGSGVISSVSDLGTMYNTALQNGLNPAKLWINDVMTFAGNGRRWARRSGLMTDTMIGEAERFYTDSLDVRDMGAKAASTMMHISGMNYVTEMRRNAFAMTMMDTLGHLARHYDSVAKLRADDRRIAQALQITEDTWAIWRLAKRESLGANHTILSPRAVMEISDEAIRALRPDADPEQVRFDAASRLIAVVQNEMDMAIITPGVNERAAMIGVERPGTWAGEIRRSFMLFKSFPWTVMTRQWGRGMSQSSTMGRFAYIGAFVLSTTLLGALSNWIVDILNGRNPRSLNPENEFGAQNWMSAVVKGGGLGFYGDFLFADTTGTRGSLLAGLAGPVASDAEALSNLTIGNAVQAMRGDETNIAKEAVRFGQSQFPNLWYTRAMTDRAIWNQLLEEVSPGALSEFKRRQQTQRGVSYYNPPDGPLIPEEGPDLSTAFAD